MKNKKVYILIREWFIEDCGDCLEVVIACDNLEKAKGKLNELKEKIIHEWENDLNLDYEIEETETTFSIWEPERYSENHDTLSIYEKEVC